eukprot:c8442_g1_i1.p1 GENE.c8442_g1_i1~~c8442_g1_i1.p1  ORF type:complete len:1152 (-),score=401.33 c8442_g1_i1:68-3523(-)
MPKPNKKKQGKSVDSDDDAPSEVVEPQTPAVADVQEADDKKKKGKGKSEPAKVEEKPTPAPAPAPAPAAEIDPLDALLEDDEYGGTRSAKRKAKGKGKAPGDGDEKAEATTEGAETPAETDDKKKKKKKKGGKGKPGDKDDEDEEEAAPTPAPAPAVTPVPPATAAKKGKDGKPQEAAPAAAPAPAAPAPAAANKKDKGKSDKADAKTEVTPAVTPAAPTPAPSESATPEPAEAEGEGDDDDEEETEEGANKKNKKKKKPKAKEEVKKPTGKKAAMLAIIAEQKRLKEEQEAAQRRAEEEARRAEEEEQRRLEEEARKKEEAKQRKKEKEKAKREKDKLEGKAITAAQKEREAKNKAFLQHLAAQGSVPVDVTAAPAAPEAEPAKKKKIVYENKKKGKKQSNDLENADQAQSNQTQQTSGESKDEPESWEDAAVDDWEAKVDEIQSSESSDDDDEAPAKPRSESIDNRANATPSPKLSAAPAPSPKLSAAPSPKHAPARSPSLTPAANPLPPPKAGASPARTASVPQAVPEPQPLDGAPANEQEPPKDGYKLRSPICCILGHVDTGKTKLLDKIRRTNVQEGEAGGITQQIGATYFPLDRIQDQTLKVSDKATQNLKVPGLLIIDTPGHESFTNLRSRGSSLCDIAILVVDIMHGLEPQTLESIGLLKARRTPFIVALNKVDRLYGWKSVPMSPIRDALKLQNADVIREFNTRVEDTIRLFNEQGLNAQVYFKNKDLKKTISMVPTSAISGEGIPDMLLLLMQLTQTFMTSRLMYLSETLQCTVLEVKVVDGLGTTIDVILANGTLREGDTIILNGLNGAIVTTIRALLTPEPMKELRVKTPYLHHKELHAAIGCKISAQNLESAIAGSELIVVREGDDIEELKDRIEGDFDDIVNKYLTKGSAGVFVQASTLGSLEALLEFLKTSEIPVSGINIGPVHKKDVVRASVMLEHDPRFACILAFDVEVVREAREMAEHLGVKIFTADIIYHLFDQFTAYMADLKAKEKEKAEQEVIFPCVLKIVPQCMFNKKDPIIMGVDVLEGILKLGTPIVVKHPGHKPGDELVELGKVTGIERDKKPVDVAKKGTTAAIKIQSKMNTQQYTYGRHFDDNDFYISKLTRRSIDVLKENFRDDLDKEDWLLVKKLKVDLGIP